MNYISSPYAIQMLLPILYFSLIIFSLCNIFLSHRHKQKILFILTESVIVFFYSILLIGCLTCLDEKDISKLGCLSSFAASIPIQSTSHYGLYLPFEFVHHYPPHSEQKEYIIKDEHQRSL